VKPKNKFKMKINIIFLLLFILSIANIVDGEEKQLDGSHLIAKNKKWSEAVKQVDSSLAESEAQNHLTRKAIAGERLSLEEKIFKLKQSVGEKKAKLNTKITKLNGMIKKEKELKEKLAREQAEIKTLEGTVRSSAKDLSLILNKNHGQVKNKQLKEELKALLDPGKYPGFKDIKKIIDSYFYLMGANGRIERFNGEYIDGHGRKVKGEIILVGPFTAYYRNKDCGFLSYDSESQSFVEVGGSLPWHVKKEIEKFFSGEDNILPIDISGGVIFKRIGRTKTFREWLSGGGFLVWPILLVGAIGILLCLERTLSLGLKRQCSEANARKAEKMLAENQLEECQEFCFARGWTPSCQVIAAGLARKDSPELRESAFQEAILFQAGKLERFLPTISVLAAIAPLLGLLGTVTGMINTFQIITLFGAGDPRTMSGGISEALITTQLGLSVAIPLMLLHHFLERRVESLINDMEEKATRFSAICASL
jgi:biopolymer transport protein ExbB